MNDEKTDMIPKYLPKGVRFFQQTIKHRDAALKRDERERKRGRDQQRKDLKAAAKRQLPSNIEEIDSELLAKIDEMRENRGVIWNCGSGEGGEALLTLLYEHYLKEGLAVRVETHAVRFQYQTFEHDLSYRLRVNIPEVAEYQKRGRERWQEGRRR